MSGQGQERRRRGVAPSEERAVLGAALGGDRQAFGGLVERYRGELRVHCYRMLGSLEEAEDLVQETFLRAWHKRGTYQGRATFRAWLYRIATNACLDALERHPVARPPSGSKPRTRPSDDTPPAAAGTPAGPGLAPLPPVAVPWLEPFPDHLLEEVASGEAGPDAVVVARETIELVFLAAIQHLPPRQRAALILRDVLGWPASAAAEALEVSVAAVNSALQRARPALQRHLPAGRSGWAAPAEVTQEERAVLRRYMDAIHRADDATLAELLRADVRVGHQPGAGGWFGTEPAWYAGRDVVLAGWAPVLHGPDAQEFRILPTGANRQPAAALYTRRPGDGPFTGFALAVLSIQDGRIVEVSVFTPDRFGAFGLPAAL